MNKQDIVNKLAEKGYTKKDSSCILDDVFAVITEAMIAGEEVKIHGFGVFSVVERAPRRTLDLKTQEYIDVPARKAPKFKAGTLLNRAIKEGFVRE